MTTADAAVPALGQHVDPGRGGVQQDVGEVIPERASAPNRRVRDVGQAHQGPCDVADQNCTNVRQVLERRVFDDQAEIVVDERVVERICIEQHRQERRAGSGQGKPVPKARRRLVCSGGPG